jgi:hypothetical protein
VLVLLGCVGAPPVRVDPPDVDLGVSWVADSGSDSGGDSAPPDSEEDSGPPDTGPDGPPGPGELCDPDGVACADGLLCCTACCLPDTQPVCTAADAYGECPLPDIFLDEPTFLASIEQDDYEASTDGCAVTEGCVLGPGTRKVLRFTTLTPNLGTADLIVGDPALYPDRFDWSVCHEHYHYKDFAEYRLYDEAGAVVLTGHKQAFCLMDAIPWFEIELPTYNCAYQGISMNWADSYGGDLDCQWIDVTDVTPGNYQLEVAINPTGVFEDRDRSNDTLRTPVSVE